MDRDRQPQRHISPSPRGDDRRVDGLLRPQHLADFTGQELLKTNLGILIEAAKARGEALDHILFHGPPGLGKTTLAHIVANEMNVNIRITAGPVIERSGDLAAILTNLRAGDILFIDEVHRLGRAVEEILYPAMEDFVLDLVVGKGPGAKNVRLKLPHFTVIGATTRLALLTAPLRARFGAHYRMEFYSEKAIQSIVRRGAAILEVPIDDEGAAEIARRARGTPRVSLRLLRRVRDFAQVRAEGAIDRQVALEALNLLEIDELGLTISTAACSTPSSASSAAARWAWRRLPPQSAKSRTPSWTWSSPTCCSWLPGADCPRRVATLHAYAHLGVPLPPGAKWPNPIPAEVV